MIRFDQWSIAEREIQKRRANNRQIFRDNRRDVMFYDGISVDFAYRCSGSSMESTFRNGDLVFIHAQETFSDGQIVALRIGNGRTLKRLYRLPDGYRLVPDNREFDSVDIRGADADQVKIIGIAIGRQCGRG